MNAAHLNLYQVCRLCLCELNGSSFVPIFDNKDSNLSHKIKSCFSISVDETDRLPNVLCPACTRDVERFYKFKEKVLKNNSFLRTYVSQRDRKAAQFINRKDDGRGSQRGTSPVKLMKPRLSATTTVVRSKQRTPTKIKTETYQDSSECLPALNNFNNCELSNTFFDNSNKVKVEIIPQVDNDMYTSSGGVYGEIKNNVVEMWPPSSLSEESTSGFRPIKSKDTAAATIAVDGSIEIPENSASKSPDYTSVIRHSNDDYGNSSSTYDKYISVHHLKDDESKEGNMGEEYDSEDTKSAASLTFREEEEDKLIIDEETMEVKQLGSLRVRGGETVKTSDSCILLRTLISTSSANQTVHSAKGIESVKKPSTFSPQILVQNDMPDYSPSYDEQSPQDDSNTSNSEKSSTRRKQKCPIKSAHELPEIGEDSDEDNPELAPLAEQQPQSIIYHQEIVNISPVTVTCSSNGREEIVGYNQSQFLDEVLSRHSSPATTPPMVGPSQAERLHKACDVLLRAASKIQDLPPGIQQEEVVVEEDAESITLYPNPGQIGQSEQITIRHDQAPLYEINLSSVNSLTEASRVTKKMKSREKMQNMPAQKECNNCHAVQTTIWRRDRFGNIVCNACGLYYKLHNYDRPCRMRRDEIHKRNRKRNAREIVDKAIKKNKRNSGGSYELESSREQENSSGSFTPPTNYNESSNHMSMSDLYNQLSANGSMKKRRRTSAPGSTSVSVTDDNECSFQGQVHEIQTNIDNIEEVSINGTEVVESVDISNHVFDQQQEKLNMSAFQLSTHFVPINGKVYDEDFSNENSMSETPLNLATDSH